MRKRWYLEAGKAAQNPELQSLEDFQGASEKGRSVQTTRYEVSHRHL